VARGRRLKRGLEQCLRENLTVKTSGNFAVPSLVCTIEMLGIDNAMFSVDSPYEPNLADTEFLNNLPFGTPIRKASRLAMHTDSTA